MIVENLMVVEIFMLPLVFMVSTQLVKLVLAVLAFDVMVRKGTELIIVCLLVLKYW